jgi:putative membrane protein
MQKAGLVAGAFLASALMASPAFAKDDSAKFAKDAADGGMAEVQMGQLVAGKASNSDVKQFAQRMVDDHGKANSELEQIAAKKNIALPKDVSKKHKSLHDKLAKQSGDKLDKEYMKDMVKDHEDDVKKFRKQANEGTDPDVAAFAKKTLPTLESHLQMAKDTYNKVK